LEYTKTRTCQIEHTYAADLDESVLEMISKYLKLVYV